ncbi:MAG TPA: HAD-IB family phosphatase [Thermoanaerobaculia bacterium]|nr:HAD-IB family phosphatase [Thermoanaerobaculia bacterium]
MTPKPFYQTLFLDVDSTLVTIEGIDALADGDLRIAALTEAAMNGEIPLEEVYRQRLELIRPTRLAIDRLGQQYLDAMLPDVDEVLMTLRDAGVNLQLITAGIEQAVLPLATKLGIARGSVHAVALRFTAEGEYLDFNRASHLTRSGGKETVVRDIRARRHGRAAFVGDGMTDLETKDAVDLFIGFGGVKIRESVRAGADFYLTEPRLAALIPIILEGEHARRIE